MNLSSYLNYEINKNLENIERLRLINKKNTSEKYIKTPTGKNNIIQQMDKSIISKNLTNKVIHIVYQYEYKNQSVTGFGDLLRCIYFMLQFSEKYKLKFEINICNHNIKKYLNYFCNKSNVNDIISSNIYFYDKTNYKYTILNNKIKYEYIDIDEELLNYINNLHCYNNHLYLYLINHPNKNIITETHKDFVRKLIEPTDEVKKNFDNFILNLNLQKKNYIVIHIRYYDEPVIKPTNFFLERINYIINLIRDIKNKYRIDILLLTSQNVIKNYIIKHFPYIKTHFNPICHTCDNNSTDEKMVNTLKDFYVMSYSKYIYSFSVYEHGSGFSEWCAETYNIPYVCYSIK